MSSSAALNPLDYELPKTPKAIMDAWMPRLQAIAIVTALLAGIEAQLISNLPDPSNFANSFVRFFAFSGLILNLGATLSTILLLIAVTSLPTTARHIYVSCPHGYPRKLFHGSSSSIDDLSKHFTNRSHIFLDALGSAPAEIYILRAFGIARGWSFMLHHCIACLLGGCFFTFVHISLNLWLTESTGVAAGLMFMAAISFLPPLIISALFMGSPACQQCKANNNPNDRV